MKSARFLAFLAALQLCCRLVPAADVPTSDQFRGQFCDAFALADSKLIYLATSQSLYTGDRDATKWTSVLSLTDRHVVQIAGGNQKLIYLLVDDRAKDSTFSLCAYSPKTGLTPIQRVPNQACSFYTDMLGAVAKGESVGITNDGGKSWKSFPIVPKRPEPLARVVSLNWASSTRLLVSDGSEMYLLSVDKDGGATMAWSVPIDAERIGGTIQGAQLWSVSPLKIWNSDSGRQELSFDTEVAADNILVQDGLAWIWATAGEAAACSVTQGKMVEKPLKVAPVVRIVPLGGDEALIFDIEGKISIASSKTGEARLLRPNFDNSVIDKELEKLAQEAQAGKASPEEIQTMSRLAVKAGPEAQRAIFKKMEGKVFKDEREKIQWLSEQLRLEVERQGAGTK